jgi:hypothetical protein
MAKKMTVRITRCFNGVGQDSHFHDVTSIPGLVRVLGGYSTDNGWGFKITIGSEDAIKLGIGETRDGMLRVGCFDLGYGKVVKAS